MSKAPYPRLLLTAVAVLLVGYLWHAIRMPPQTPDIQLATITGEEIALKNLTGAPLLVTFWATTCPGCVKEIPHLSALYRELSPRGFQLIGIAMSYDQPSQVLAMSEAHHIPYPVALDIMDQAALAFGDVRVTPSSFLINPDGRIVHSHTGQLDISATRSMILDMLAGSS